MTPTCGWCRRTLTAANSRGYCCRRCEDRRRWHGEPQGTADALQTPCDLALARARAALGGES